MKTRDFVYTILVIFVASSVSAMYDMVFALIANTDPEHNLARFESMMIVFIIISAISISIIYGSKKNKII